MSSKKAIKIRTKLKLVAMRREQERGRRKEGRKAGEGGLAWRAKLESTTRKRSGLMLWGCRHRQERATTSSALREREITTPKPIAHSYGKLFQNGDKTNTKKKKTKTNCESNLLVQHG